MRRIEMRLRQNVAGLQRHYILRFRALVSFLKRQAGNKPWTNGPVFGLGRKGIYGRVT